MRLTTEVQPLAEETEGADRRSPVALGARRPSWPTQGRGFPTGAPTPILL